MADQDNSIFEEINEELKHDKIFQFIKNNKNALLATVAIIVVGIIGYSSWFSNKNKQLEMISTSMVDLLRNPSNSNERIIESLIADAPSEISPLLNIISSGKNLIQQKDSAKYGKILLDLSEKKNIDIIWRDLAIIMYCSYRLELQSDLLKRLEPLTANERPFKFAAIEEIALIEESNGHHQKALDNFQKIIDAKDAPNTLKNRIKIIHSYIKNNLLEK